MAREREEREHSGGIEDRVLVLYHENVNDLQRPLKPTDPMHEGGASSLQSVLFVSGIEREFGIELSMRDYYATDSLRDLAALIERRIGND